MSSKTTTNKSTAGKTSKSDEVIALAKAIDAIAKNRDQFTAAVNQLSELNEETLRNMATVIDAKRQEFEQMEIDQRSKIEALDTEFSEKKRRREVETATHVKEFRRAAATEILLESGEVPINAEELASLRSQLDALKSGQEEAVKQAVRAEKQVLIAQHESQVKQAQLSNAAETAQIKAQLEQKDQQIESLNTQIKDLKAELSAQRELTRQVAESASQSKISQVFGQK